MKEYGRLVLWLDYFDSRVTRRHGRRVPLHLAVKAPTLQELLEAARKAGLEPQPAEARFPSRPQTPSGYISVARAASKSSVIMQVAKQLTAVKGIARSE